ncbi:hypothetical protein ABK040_009060 [Willaertia magna]
MGLGVSSSRSRLAFQELPDINNIKRKSVKRINTNNRLYEGEIYKNPNDPTVGYQVIKLVGRGTFGEVYHAKQLSLSQQPPTTIHTTFNSARLSVNLNNNQNNNNNGSNSGNNSPSMNNNFGGNNNNTDIAIKIIIKPEKLKDLEKIQNEIEIMKSLKHSNILNLLDTFEMKDEKQQDCIVLISEYCELGSIADYLEGNVVISQNNYNQYSTSTLLNNNNNNITTNHNNNNNNNKTNQSIINKLDFPVWTVTNWFVEMIESIKYCSEKNVIHRDIKPSNMLIETLYHGQMTSLKLADFGLSKAIQYRQMANTMCGSPLYAAPEIYNRTGYTSAVDVYSLGVTILELACAFSHDDFSEIVVEEPKRVMELFNSVKLPSVKELIMKMIHPDPLVRISIQDLSNHLFVKTYRVFLNLRRKMLESNLFMVGVGNNNNSGNSNEQQVVCNLINFKGMNDFILNNLEELGLNDEQLVNSKEFNLVMLEAIVVVNLYSKMNVLFELLASVIIMRYQLQKNNEKLIDLLLNDDMNIKSLYEVYFRFKSMNHTEISNAIMELLLEYARKGDQLRLHLLNHLGSLNLEDNNTIIAKGNKEKNIMIRDLMRELFQKDRSLKVCAQKVNWRRKVLLEMEVNDGTTSSTSSTGNNSEEDTQSTTTNDSCTNNDV